MAAERHRTCVYLCNAIDEHTRVERGIDTDSPAATKKVWGVAEALSSAGVRTVVLSLGRGRQRGSGRYHPAKAARIGNAAVIYAPFLDRWALTHVVSLLGLVPLLSRIRRRRGQRTLLVFNRLPHYLLGVVWARWLGFRNVLDLEDGDIVEGRGRLGRLLLALLRAAYDATCEAGAVLASRGLAAEVRTDRTICCYGIARPAGTERDWTAAPVLVLWGGTLQHTTGASLFIDAVERLRKLPGGRPALEFAVTGKGDMSHELERLAAVGEPRVRFLGSVSRDEYRDLLRRAHVGLALNLPSSQRTRATFPSKVIELAEQGLLVVSTRASDVPILFGEDGAVFLDAETGEALAQALIRIVEAPAAARSIARRGSERIAQSCSRERVGTELAAFLFQ